MHLLKDLCGGIRRSGLSVRVQNFNINNLNQVRTATKRVSGSRTNKNDSAGRRLGPKVYEGHFVKPGQIIMRQRGTKIHPGENVGIGKDHTIYALEPGYIRFYYNPFHPMRKFVGIALKRTLSLPSDHFMPRLRRFGRTEITDPLEAQKEEDNMCRKEFLSTPKLRQTEQKKEERFKLKLDEIKTEMCSKLEFSEEELESGALRLYKIMRLLHNGEPISAVRSQVTYDYIFDLKTNLIAGNIDRDTFEEQSSSYQNFAKSFDSKLSIDESGRVYEYLTEEEKAQKKEEIVDTLEAKYTNKLISAADKEEIMNLLQTPGIFSIDRQQKLKAKYIPAILPLTVQESVVLDIDPKAPPKDVTVVKIFDQKTRKVQVIGRTKEAFLA